MYDKKWGRWALKALHFVAINIYIMIEMDNLLSSIMLIKTKRKHKITMKVMSRDAKDDLLKETANLHYFVIFSNLERGRTCSIAS